MFSLKKTLRGYVVLVNLNIEAIFDIPSINITFFATPVI